MPTSCNGTPADPLFQVAGGCDLPSYKIVMCRRRPHFFLSLSAARYRSVAVLAVSSADAAAASALSARTRDCRTTRATSSFIDSSFLRVSLRSLASLSRRASAVCCASLTVCGCGSAKFFRGTGGRDSFHAEETRDVS